MMTRKNLPVGRDSDLRGDTVTLGEDDRWTLREMRTSVQRAAEEPLSGRRVPVVDPVTGEWSGAWIGSRTLKPDWMRDPDKPGTYLGSAETLKAIDALLAGTWPRTRRQDALASHLDTVLHLNAEEERARALGSEAESTERRALDPDAAALASMESVTLPVARPRVGLDTDTGTLVLGPRSPLKGRFTMVNRMAGHRAGCRCVACSPATRERGMRALRERAERRAWLGVRAPRTTLERALTRKNPVTPAASRFISRHTARHQRVYGMPPAQAVRVAYEEAAGKGYRVPALRRDSAQVPNPGRWVVGVFWFVRDRVFVFRTGTNPYKLKALVPYGGTFAGGWGKREDAEAYAHGPFGSGRRVDILESWQHLPPILEEYARRERGPNPQRMYVVTWGSSGVPIAHGPYDFFPDAFRHQQSLNSRGFDALVIDAPSRQAAVAEYLRRTAPEGNPRHVSQVALHFQEYAARESVARLQAAGIHSAYAAPGAEGSGVWAVYVPVRSESKASRILARRPNPVSDPDSYQAGLAWAARAHARRLWYNRQLEAESVRMWRRTLGVPVLPVMVESFRQGFRVGFGRVDPNPLTRSETSQLLREARGEQRLLRPRRAPSPFRGFHIGQGMALERVARVFGVKPRGPTWTWMEWPAVQGNPLTRGETARVLSAARSDQRAARVRRGTSSGMYYGGRADRGAEIAWAFGQSRQRRGPPPYYASNSPAVLGSIPGAMQEIRYRRTGRNPGPYSHRFGPGVQAYALSDGSVLLRGGKRLWTR